MANFLYLDLPSFTDICTTGLNSLADGSSATLGNTTETDNGTDRKTHGVAKLSLASVNLTAVGWVDLYAVPKLDGTNYPEMTASTNVPPAHYWVGSISTVVKNGTQVQYSTPFPLPPEDFKLVCRNKTGVTWASSGNVLSVATFNIADA